MNAIVDDNERYHVEDRVATHKDLLILKLEIQKEFQEEIHKLQYKLGGLIVAGFSVLGYLVVWVK